MKMWCFWCFPKTIFSIPECKAWLRAPWPSIAAAADGGNAGFEHQSIKL